MHKLLLIFKKNVKKSMNFSIIQLFLPLLILIQIFFLFSCDSHPSASDQKTAELSSKPGILFMDPGGFYRVILPKGFKVTVKSWQHRSKQIFTYSDKISVTVIAGFIKNEWDAREQMEKKLLAIKSGSSPFPISGTEKYSNGLLKLNGANGYEIRIDSGDNSVELIALVQDDLSASIAVVCMGEDHVQNCNILVNSIKQHFFLRTS